MVSENTRQKSLKNFWTLTHFAYFFPHVFILPGCDILQIVLELKYTERNMPKTNEIFACFVFFTRIISEDFPLQEKQKPKREEKKVEIF